MATTAELFTINASSLYAKANGFLPSDRVSIRIAIATGELPARKLPGPRGAWVIEREHLIAFFRMQKRASGR